MGGSIHVALVPFVCLELFHILVRLLFSPAALFVNGFPQRRVSFSEPSPQRLRFTTSFAGNGLVRV
jgi:hypothetical protein